VLVHAVGDEPQGVAWRHGHGHEPARDLAGRGAVVRIGEQVGVENADDSPFGVDDQQ